MEWFAEQEKRGQPRHLPPCLIARRTSSDTPGRLVWARHWRGTDGSNEPYKETFVYIER
jgi:hypothetical protein